MNKSLLVTVTAMLLCITAAASARQEQGVQAEQNGKTGQEKKRNLSADILQGFMPLYAVSGFPIDGTSVNRHTGDVKFQISLALSLWKDMGNVEGLDLLLGYSQRSVWMLYEDSSPFKDNMFIPGVYINIPIQYRKQASKADILCGIEHRSNGRSDELSRSLNYLFGQFTNTFPFGLTLAAELRTGFGWYDEAISQALFYRFYSYASFGALYEKGRFSVMASLSPCFAPFFINRTVELSFRISRQTVCPFHLFVQYHQGYDECMCDIVNGVTPPHYLRFGVLITPRGSRRLRL